MNETPKKSILPKITNYFSPNLNSNITPIKSRTRSTRIRSPSPSPPRPTQSQKTNHNHNPRESARLKRKSQEPPDCSDPKIQKVGPPRKKKEDKSNSPSLEEIAEVPSTTLDDLKTFLTEKFETQDQKLSEKFKTQENRLQETIEQQNSHFKSLTEPLIEKQKTTDLQLDILRDDLEAQKKETSENKKIIFKMLGNN